MVASLLAIAVFAGLAALVVRWAEADYGGEGKLSGRSTVGGWLLYLFHADSVATAAYAGALQINVVPSDVMLGAGIVVGTVGVVLFVSAVSRLSKVVGDSPQLQTGGVFRLVRHPQNVGWGLVLLGIACAGRSVLALVLVALFAVFVSRYAKVEETHLEEQFGEEWRLYRDRTPAMLWWPGRHQDAIA